MTAKELKEMEAEASVRRTTFDCALEECDRLSPGTRLPDAIRLSIFGPAFEGVWS